MRTDVKSDSTELRPTSHCYSNLEVLELQLTQLLILATDSACFFFFASLWWNSHFHFAIFSLVPFLWVLTPSAVVGMHNVLIFLPLLSCAGPDGVKAQDQPLCGHCWQPAFAKDLEMWRKVTLTQSHVACRDQGPWKIWLLWQDATQPLLNLIRRLGTVLPWVLASTQNTKHAGTLGICKV